MRTIKLILAIGTAAAALALTSCSSPTTGTAQPTTGGSAPTTGSSPSSTSSGLPKYGAPKVTDPLDVTKFKTDPCSLIPIASVQSAGVDSPVLGSHDDTGASSVVGPNCGWNGNNASVGVALLTKQDLSGLSSAYSSKSADAVFQPLTVAGYPAVIALQQDSRAQGECTVTVGIQDNLVFHTTAVFDTMTGQHNDPCTLAEKLAEAAVTTIKSAG